MKLTEIKSIISQVIAEAKENGGLKSKGTNLVDYKRELEGLRQFKESLSQYSVNEGGEQPQHVVEFADHLKYSNELKKIQELSSKLSETLSGKISEVEAKIVAETKKIKQMIGLIPAESAPKKEAKAKPSKSEKKEEPKEEKEEPKKDKK